MAMSPTVWHPAVARLAATKYRFCFYSATSVVARTSASLEGCYFTVAFGQCQPALNISHQLLC